MGFFSFVVWAVGLVPGRAVGLTGGRDAPLSSLRKTRPFVTSILRISQNDSAQRSASPHFRGGLTTISSMKTRWSPVTTVIFTLLAFTGTLRSN